VTSIGEIEREYCGTIDSAAILDCSTKRVAQFVRAGALPAARTRLGYLFKREDVENFARERAGMARDARGHVRVTR
jgi:excisionase family DNA binding protein